MNKLWHLAQINLFDELPMEDLQMIDAMAPMSTIHKGTLICSPDTRIRTLYFLKNGRVRLYKMNEDGKQLTVGLLGKGALFGETDTFSTGTGSVYIEAIDDALVCVLSKQDFEMLLTQKPQIALKLVSLLTTRIRDAEQMLENFAFRDVRYRLLYLLSKLANTFHPNTATPASDYTELDIRLSHQELANMIGATRESVSVALSQLAKDDVVVTGRREIAIDLRKAAAILGER